MIVTEKEAQHLECHRMLRPATAEFQGASTCYGSQCMAWKWVTNINQTSVTKQGLQSCLERGMIECAAPPERTNDFGEDGLWVQNDPQKRTGCCGLVYPTDD